MRTILLASVLSMLAISAYAQSNYEIIEASHAEVQVEAEKTASRLRKACKKRLNIRGKEYVEDVLVINECTIKALKRIK